MKIINVSKNERTNRKNCMKIQKDAIFVKV